MQATILMPLPGRVGSGEAASKVKSLNNVVDIIISLQDDKTAVEYRKGCFFIYLKMTLSRKIAHYLNDWLNSFVFHRVG